MRRGLILLLVGHGLAVATLAGPAVTDPRIIVDQFGYRPGAVKIAVLREPHIGFDAPDPFLPAPTYQVRRWGDDSVALSGPVVAWNGGAVHPGSGDRVWWFDFSALSEEGSFYVFDPSVGAGSYRFEIDDSVYREVLRHAVRSFYYQRCGAVRDPLHAGTAWADAACHLGPQQDLDSRWVLDTTPATSRNLSGGWHDAGDYNKYMNFADTVVHDLVAAYEDAPAVWGDDLGIPESGNNLPDLLDELRWELDWMLKMQQPDGSVLHKISVTDFGAASPPSSDGGVRRYADATASATISACGALAHAAVAYGALPDPATQAYAAQLEAAARSAWEWLEANPGLIPSAYANTGFMNVPAEDDAYQQDANRTCAASYLYVLTGETGFRDYFDAHYTDVHMMQWRWIYPFEDEYQDCLLYYGRAPGATSAVVDDIQSAFGASLLADYLTHVTAGDDPYRAHLLDGWYVWGSNGVKAAQGSMYAHMIGYALDPGAETTHRDAAEGYLHYLHGVNPMGMTYLSNMAASGAERSIQEFYHSWFSDGSDWDNATTSLHGPPPGFVPGGPNSQFSPDPVYGGPALQPPMGQPDQKSYRDWNTSWPENSWEVTENAIGYQSAVVRLLAGFVPPLPLSVTDPADETECLGSAFTLQAAAAGAPPLSYRWRRNGLDLADGGTVGGAATPVLTVDPAGIADTGSYDVVVHDVVNGSVTSAAANVMVRAPPVSPGNTLAVAASGTDVVLSWAPVAEASSYEVLRCDASAGPCVPGPYAAGPTTPLVDDLAPGPHYWYQVRALNECGTSP